MAVRWSYLLANAHQPHLGRLIDEAMAAIENENPLPDLKADFILANPQFNMKEWGGEQLREDKRWKFGSPSPESLRPCWRKV